jgi:hypothetical protein
MIEQFLKWVIAWSKIFDGVMGVITLGFWFPNTCLYFSKKLANYRYHTLNKRSIS